MALHPYPNSIPPETWTTLLDLWQGKIADKIEAMHVAWHCVGFALSKFDLNHPPLIGDASAVANYAGADIGAVPWNVILTVAIEVLKKILAELN